jgi:hypothetical protein
MSRQPYVNNNNTWSPVKGLWVDNVGTWTQAKGMWENQNGVWVRVWPPDPVTAQILVVGGGGGGGGPSGYEGGGGGGAGGVVYSTNTVISAVNNSYAVVVGAGGAQDTNGGNSSFGTASLQDDTVDQTIYEAPYPVYTGFLSQYGVWNYNPPSEAPAGTITLNYTTYLANGGTYTLITSADNRTNSISFNGGPSVLSEEQWWNTASTTVALPPGTNTISITATNDGGPASVAAALIDSSGNVIWNTRSPLNGQTHISGLLALGGGHGGYGPTQNGPGANGASGGGGSGYVQNAPGGSGYPGQGNAGGTGIWQGYGQAGGGGGGGYLTAGNSSNGNQGGDGGNGTIFTVAGQSYAVGGGGGGGYGSQSSGGTGPGGAGGFGGGGDGNGGNGVNGTGGGGGGDEHSGIIPGGSGGSGGVYVGYVSPTGQPLFVGGDSVSVVTNADFSANIVHIFQTPGTYSLVGLNT